MNNTFWLILGVIGQGLFFMRFVVQWWCSEKEKKSVIPVRFWHFSIIGSTILLIYSIHRRDPIFIAGYAVGLMIYLRNLYFIYREAGMEWH